MVSTRSKRADSLRVVDRGQVDEVIHLKLSVALQELGDLRPILHGHDNLVIAERIARFEHSFRELGLKPVDDRLAHELPSRVLPAARSGTNLGGTTTGLRSLA